MNEIKRDTAAGPDQMNLKELKQIKPEKIALILNKWWGNEIPDSVKECRTTLLPKTNEEREKVGNWRPITIGNLFMRLYAKIWDKRLRANVILDERQKGFVPVDGCFQNVKILQQIIKQQRKRKKEYNIVFLDLAKAFDTISHKSIKKGLMRKGVPDEVVEGILEMYQNSSTIITLKGKSTRRIAINSGVKQGCPLSPLLFNIVMDELIERLKKRKIGVEVGGELITVMAFADDLVLVTEDASHMTIALYECEQYFKQKGLKVNSGKCGSMRILPVKGKKNMKVVTATHRKWNESPIPTLDFKRLSKYLGVHIRINGEIALPIEEWSIQLERLRRSHLNALQKIQSIRQAVIAKILYHLRLSDHGLGMARKLEKLIRKEFKLILHLPSWTSTQWIHHRKGGNIPSLLQATMISRKKASEKMKLDSDPIAREIGDRIDPLNGERLERLGIKGNNWKNIKDEQKCRSESIIEKQNNGKAILTMFESTISRDWLWSDRGLTPGDKIRSIQALSNTSPNQMNKTRGEPDVRRRRCRKCNEELEDDQHILNKCKLNEGLMTRRHDHLVKKIGKELRRSNSNGKIWIERAWRNGREIVRPDLTIVDENRHCTVIEVTCPYEISKKYLQQREEEKRAKYKRLVQHELSQVECETGEVVSIVIGSMGTIPKKTNENLKKMKLTRQREALQMTVMKGSVNILNSHFRRDDFKKR